MAGPVNQAAWRTLPKLRGTFTIGATTTAVDLTGLEGMVIAWVADADTRILATNTEAAPTALATSFPVVADTPIEFKVLRGDQLAAIGACELYAFETG